MALRTRVRSQGCSVAELRGQAWEIRLPTESEWEKVARYLDGRLYPWGNQFDATKCNVNETGIGRTRVVGIFPNGANYIVGSPIYDFSGNVREWCPSHWSKEYQFPEENNADGNHKRVIRGGAYYDLGHAGFRGSSFGFRVVCAPAPHLPPGSLIL